MSGILTSDLIQQTKKASLSITANPVAAWPRIPSFQPAYRPRGRAQRVEMGRLPMLATELQGTTSELASA